MKKKLFIFSNESINSLDGKFYCDNIDLKTTPEGLNKKFDVNLFGRKSNINRSHEIKIKKTQTSNNIFSYISSVIATTKEEDAKYLIISISPYTFIASLFLFLFRKKVYVYLISSGYEEWKFILGSWSVWIYHIMFKIVTSNSTVIALHDRLYKKKNGHVIASSTLDDNWLKNFKEVKLDKARFLNVSRVNPEKGIYEFLEMFKDVNLPDPEQYPKCFAWYVKLFRYYKSRGK